MRFVVIGILILSAGGVWLQINLSKKDGGGRGFILPIIFFCISVTAALSVILLNRPLPEAEGAVVSYNTSRISLIMTVVYFFLICNVPTCIFLVVYAICRAKRNNRRFY